MPHTRKCGPTAAQLQELGLRATDQRMALLALLFGSGDRHVTAEGLYREARAAGIAVVRATVYNTLRALAGHGLVRPIVVDSERTYFDTNPAHGCHIYCEETGELHHLGDCQALQGLLAQLGHPAPAQVDILIRLKAGQPRAAGSRQSGDADDRRAAEPRSAR